MTNKIDTVKELPNIGKEAPKKVINPETIPNFESPEAFPKLDRPRPFQGTQYDILNFITSPTL